MAKEKAPIIDKEVFDTFFHENYCAVDYENVKSEFENVINCGADELFIDTVDFAKVTKKNFIVYLRSSIYGEFEAIVEEVFDSLNPEIADAVMDVSCTMEEQDEITSVYWSTSEELLKKFLGQLFDEKIEEMIKRR